LLIHVDPDRSQPRMSSTGTSSLDTSIGSIFGPPAVDAGNLAARS
jgi:hypothetical protein